jgi:hypothetical protein
MELCLFVFVGVVLLAFVMDTILGRPATCTRAGRAVLYPGLLRTVAGEKAMLTSLSLSLSLLSSSLWSSSFFSGGSRR